jgi:hypothetical protein
MAEGGRVERPRLALARFRDGAVANRLALPHGPSGRYRTCTSGVSSRRADFYATDGWCQRRATIPQPPRCGRGALPVELRWFWSDREESNLRRLCIRQVHSTVVLRSEVSARGDSNSGRLVISKLLSPLSYGPCNIGGPERICTSTARRRFYRALGSLMPSRPEGNVERRTENSNRRLHGSARWFVLRYLLYALRYLLMWSRQ